MNFKQNTQTKRVIDVLQTLAEQRIYIGLTDLAKQLKFSQPTLSMVLNGQRNAPASLQLKICEKFAVNPQYLTKGIQPIFVKELQRAKTFLMPKDPLSIQGVNYRITYIIEDIVIKKHHDCQTIKDVAKKLKINQSILSQISKYKTIAPAYIIQKLGMVFDVSADWILFNEGNAYRQHNTNSIYNLKREVAVIKDLLSDK